MNKSQLLKDINSGKVKDIREKAKNLVKEKNEEKVWDLIEELIDEEDWRLRSLVGELLGKLASKRAFSKLKGLAKGEEDWRVNETYQMALKSFLEGISKREFLKEVRPKLRDWIETGDEKVKRMVSEGTRPRKTIAWLKSDPEVIIPVLEELRDDESHYVRESVANNLKDIGKAHPKFLVKTLRKWLKESDKPKVKRMVIKALEKVIEEEYELAAPLLEELAEDSNKRVAGMAERRLKER